MADVPAEEIIALLDRPLGEVVSARNARVKELRRAGERELARALSEVRRPSRLVWDVGQLAKVAPEEAAAAVAASEDLEAAQEAGGSIRGPLRAVRDAIAAVAAHAGGDAAEVGLALRTVLGDAEARTAWLGGFLLELPGDDEDPDEGEPEPEPDPDPEEEPEAEPDPDPEEEPEPDPEDDEDDEEPEHEEADDDLGDDELDDRELHDEPEPEADAEARAALEAVREELDAVRTELEAARAAADEAHAAVTAALARATEAVERADGAAAPPDEDGP